MRTLMIICVAGVLAMLTGCAGGGGATRAGAGDSSGAGVSDYLHQKAMQSFINGSLYEMKGDNAQAILEYQDALSYEKTSSIYSSLRVANPDWGNIANAAVYTLAITWLFFLLSDRSLRNKTLI